MMLWKWRYVYARPLWRRTDVARYAQLHEQGADRYAGRVLAQSMQWRPYWRRRDGSLRLTR
jgi:hypothetical protein